MINALKSKFREYGNGVLQIVNGGNVVERCFKFSIIDEKEKQFNTPIQNLVSSQADFSVRTSWDLPFKVGQRVKLNGEWYKINRCSRHVMDINEQSLGLLKASYSAEWVLVVTR